MSDEPGMKIWNAPIPRNKMGQFHEILLATGGYYLNNPRDQIWEGFFRVDYVPGEETEKRFQRCCQDVKEVRKDQWWRVFLRRLFWWSK